MKKLLEKWINESDYEEGTDLLTIKNVRLSALLLCVAAELIAVFVGDPKTFGVGLLLGGIMAQLLFRQHELSISKMFSRGGNGRSDYFLRLILRGITLYAAIKNPKVSIIGCLIGLLSISYAIYLMAFLNAFILKKRKEEQDD